MTHERARRLVLRRRGVRALAQLDVRVEVAPVPARPVAGVHRVREEVRERHQDAEPQVRRGRRVGEDGGDAPQVAVAERRHVERLPDGVGRAEVAPRSRLGDQHGAGLAERRGAARGERVGEHRQQRRVREQHVLLLERRAGAVRDGHDGARDGVHAGRGDGLGERLGERRRERVARPGARLRRLAVPLRRLRHAEKVVRVGVERVEAPLVGDVLEDEQARREPDRQPGDGERRVARALREVADGEDEVGREHRRAEDGGREARPSGPTRRGRGWPRSRGRCRSARGRRRPCWRARRARGRRPARAG